jgi:hypothetical protein
MMKIISMRRHVAWGTTGLFDPKPTGGVGYLDAAQPARVSR